VVGKHGGDGCGVAGQGVGGAVGGIRLIVFFRASSRAGSLPQGDLGCKHPLRYTPDPVGASLLAKSVDQSTSQRLIYRYREQARSYICCVVTERVTPPLDNTAHTPRRPAVSSGVGRRRL
jgi:hypothetical protein